MIQSYYCVYQRIKKVNNKFDRIFVAQIDTKEEAIEKTKEFSKKFKDCEFYYEKEENIIFDKIKK